MQENNFQTQQQNADGEQIDFAYYLDVMLRRRWIILSVILLSIMASVVVTVKMTPIFQSKALVLIEKDKNSSGNNILYNDMSAIDRSNTDYYRTQYALLKSDTLLKNVADKLKLAETPEFEGEYGYKKLGDIIKIDPITNSRLVYITVNNKDPKLAADIANTLANTYIDNNLNNQLFIAKNVLAALQGRETDINVESMPAVVNNPIIQDLKIKANGLRLQVAQLSARYTSKHPEIISLNNQLETTNSQIKEETEKIVQSLKIDLSGQLMGNNVRLIDPAMVATFPKIPNKKLNLLIGVGGGIILGILIAFLVEFLDQ